jgi:hypothetical protein
MSMKLLARARAYAVPKSDNLLKFADLLAREADANNLQIVEEGGGWCLKQNDRRLSAIYSKDEIVACVTGFIAGLHTARSYLGSFAVDEGRTMNAREHEGFDLRKGWNLVDMTAQYSGQSHRATCSTPPLHLPKDQGRRT